MVVTCENCSARYKLDDNRISGRGAKITCPRCRHVFVVYRQHAETGGIRGDAAPQAAPVAPPAPTPDAREGAEAEVDALDFRKVGIQSWKVKVKIGLVYDFSDYRTLARYITEGRVTPSDKLSHDGSTWTEISEIPDLAAHFVSVYQRLEAELAAAEEDEDEEDYEDDEPTNIMGMAGASFDDSASKAVSLTSFSSSAAPRILPPSETAGASEGSGADLQAAMSAALSAEGSGEEDSSNAPVGPRFIDPFEKRKNAGRSPGPRGSSGSSSGAGSARPKARTGSGGSAVPSDSGGGRGGFLAAVVLLALAGGGAWWYLQQEQGAGTPPVATGAAAPVLTSGEGDRTREDIRLEIEADILSGTEVEEPDAPDEEAEDAWGGDEEPPKLIPIGPRGAPPPGSKSSRSMPPRAEGSSAQAHAATGETAMRRGDYAAAAAAYQKAVGMEPSNSLYNGQLGAALVRTGQMDAAMDPLMRAASGGYARAFVYLGDVAASRGDTAGAIGYYQSYLATSPRDAAAVQSKIDRLSG